MAKKKANAGKKAAVETESYNIKTLHEDREYGFYWYAWLWKLLRPILIFFCAVLIVVGIGKFGYEKVYERFIGPADEKNSQLQEFEIAEGSSATAIGSKLEKEGLIRSGSVFRYMIQLQGLTEKLSYGKFELSPSMTVSQVVKALTDGSQTNEREITILPGWTCENIADYLVKEGAIENVNQFLSACNNVDRFVAESYALKAAQDAGSLEGRKYALEGYLAPDTYRIFRTANAESIITTLLTQHNTLIDKVYYANDVRYRVDESGEYSAVENYERDLTMDGYIILASIIEKEAVSTEDMEKVSAVFHNRLKRGWRLESDPTATYMFGLSHYVLTQQELTDPNPYNTYTRDGLPIGPICNPSENALHAAIYPNMEYINGEYMYFCATDPGSGELAFAVTKEEHMENVQKYQAKWAEYDAAHSIK